MLRFFRQARRLPPKTVVATYDFRHGTVKLLRNANGNLQWSCDCPVFQREVPRIAREWCKHVAKAQARRSIDRLMSRPRRVVNVSKNA
jgi:hypothetical protein